MGAEGAVAERVGAALAEWAGDRVAVPFGAGPSAPELAGPQPASTNALMTMGRGSSLTVVLRFSLLTGTTLRRPAHGHRTARSPFALSDCERQGQPER